MSDHPFMLSCEIPLPKGGEISRLTVAFGGRPEDQYKQLANLVYELRAENTSLWACASASVSGSPPLELSLGNCSGLTIHSELMAVELATRASVEQVLTHWVCEELVMFWADHESAVAFFSSARAKEPKWWQYAPHPTRSPFLNSLHIVEPIIFFALGHQALDIFGSQKTIAQCVTTSMQFARLI